MCVNSVLELCVLTQALNMEWLGQELWIHQKWAPVSCGNVWASICHLNKCHCLVKYKSGGKWLIAKDLRQDKLES